MSIEGCDSSSSSLEEGSSYFSREVVGNALLFAARTIFELSHQIASPFVSLALPLNTDRNSLKKKVLEEFKEVVPTAKELQRTFEEVDWEKESPYFSSKVAEVAYRVYRAAWSVFLLALGGAVFLPMVALATSSVGLHAAGVWIKPQPFSHVQGEEPSEKIVDISQLSVMTYNVGWVPMFAPLNVGSHECLFLPEWLGEKFGKWWGTTDRLARIAEVIRKEDQDVICLQEMFDPFAEEMLLQKLKEDGYKHAITKIGLHPLKGSSGLTVLSKYPLKDIEFIQFSETATLDRMVNKGAIRFTVVKGNEEVVGYNTHLNCGDESSSEVRHKQLLELQENIGSLTSDQKKRLFLAGDLNFEQKKPSAEQALFCDNFEGFVDGETFTCTNLLKRMNGPTSRLTADQFEVIDNIGIWKESKGLEKKRAASVLIDKKTLTNSDHFPVCADLALTYTDKNQFFNDERYKAERAIIPTTERLAERSRSIATTGIRLSH